MNLVGGEAGYWRVGWYLRWVVVFKGDFKLNY